MNLAGIWTTLAICIAVSHAEEFQITSKPQNVEATVGQTVTLPCDYTGESNGLIRLWYRDASVVFVQQNAIFRRKYFALDGNSLVVTVTGPEAAGTFKCQFSDTNSSSLTHTITLLGPPKIETDIDEISVKENGTILIHCRSSSAPKATITYSKEGSEADLSSFVNNDVLQINGASRKHAGNYTCTAANGYPPNDSKMIVVKYEGKPDVNVAIQWVNLNSETDKAVEITCKVLSEEQVKIQWKKGRDALKPSNHFVVNSVKTDAHNLHISTLRINSISKDLFDEYTCDATNSHGNGADSVPISSLPIKPIVSVTSSDIKADITLTTVSPYRVRMFEVVLKAKNGEPRTINYKLPENEIGDADGKYTLKQNLDTLIPDSEYEGTVVAITEKSERSAAAKFNFRTQPAARASSTSALTSSIMMVCFAALVARA